MFPGANKELEVLGEDSFLLNDPNGNAAFLPFGSGTRACVGQKFVMQGVATLFATLLQHYEVCAIIFLHLIFIRKVRYFIMAYFLGQVHFQITKEVCYNFGG